MLAKISVREDQPLIEVSSAEELDRVIEDAAAEARAQDLLLIVFVEDPAGNSLSIVLGSDETVLTFTYHHLDPPYLVSKGESELEEPVLTAYGSFRHHTEYPRNWVIPLDVGIAAVHEFVLSSVPPENVEWDDV